MEFLGKKRTIKVNANYSQIESIEKFWAEMTRSFPGTEFLGLGTNWNNGTFDYYIGKIDEQWADELEAIDLPVDNWEIYECEDDSEVIEDMYRQVYMRGSLDFEIESIKDGIFTTKVHYLVNK